MRWIKIKNYSCEQRKSTHFVIFLFGRCAFVWCKEIGQFWFSILQIGFVIKNKNIQPLWFSERQGIHWAINTNNYYIRFLKNGR